MDSIFENLLITSHVDLLKEGQRVMNLCPVNLDIERGRDFDLKHLMKYQNVWLRGWNNDPQWLNFGLMFLGQPVSFAAQFCPKTIKILLEISSKRHINFAGYSLLHGNTSIKKHTDEYKEVSIDQVWHYGLITPEGCRLFVERESKTECHLEQEGKVVIFNDSLPHWAENTSNEPRLVLFIKFTVWEAQTAHEVHEAGHHIHEVHKVVGQNEVQPDNQG